MSTKDKKTDGVVTTLTLRITDETGDVGYKGTLVAARGDRAFVMQFEYFDARHMTEAIESALQKLEAASRQPAPREEVAPKTEPEAEESAFAVEDAASPEDDEDTGLPDISPTAVTAEDEASRQPSLF